jgi:hypothetical protein
MATYTEQVLAAADAFGSISYLDALKIANDHGCLDDFSQEYRNFTTFCKVDVMELLVWLGY